MADVSQVSPQELVNAWKQGLAENKTRKNAIRQNIGNAYQNLQGTPQDPQDHPANNVSHPHGNRGRLDATVPLNVPQSWPSSTGDYQDEINY